MDLTEDELKPLYQWIDQIPLSRPKRNIARDFSDGVLVAEVIAHFYPKLVELHNYSGANAMSPKVYNWQTLNARALKKLGFQIPREDFMDVCNCRAGAIERVLKLCKFKMAEFQNKHGVKGPNAAAGVAAANANGTVNAAVNGGAPGGGSGDGAGAHVAHPAEVMCENCGHVNRVTPGATGGDATSGVLRDDASEGVITTAAPLLEPEPVATFEPLKQEGVDPGIVKQKDIMISELRETNTILDAKARKLEQLVRLKDAKIQTLLNKLQALGALRGE